MENKNELKEVTKEIVGWEDNKVLRTISDLTTKPGIAIRDYCNDGKQKYLSPIVYFIGVTALETYIASAIGLFDFMLAKNMEEFRKAFSDPSLSKMFNTENITMQLNEGLSFLLSETGQKIVIIPILLLLTWLFYKKYNRSFKENSWFALYTLGHATLLAIPLMGFWYVTKNLALYTGLGLFLIFIYWVLSSKQFYNLTLAKAIVLRLLMTLTVILIINLLTIIMVVIVIMNSMK
jgi:Protein of unknown function (DUF3667).